MDCRHDSDAGLLSDTRGTPAANPDRAARRRFEWTHIEANADCALALNRINMDSNPYRAERRALVLDSLSGWLRQQVAAASMDMKRDDQTLCEHREEQGGHDGRQAANPKAAAEELLRALLEFEGIVIVVTEEAVAGLASDPWERLYIRLLAEANRRLADASHAIYRMSFGIATAIRGERL
ncbi:bifunctional adenosylcobinamide kinase/adenosylcobinamide-phosphate guanylyltransferase [Cohnella sp. 56]|uniref:bifunctional adenosylcobinamide kinase/adenosylcobinamide-phosphate guanylyltransferase n=1 Tax=Cohnella sp. 56 TaxID=3113722 RepID=UPI0030E8887A